MSRCWIGVATLLALLAACANAPPWLPLTPPGPVAPTTRATPTPTYTPAPTATARTPLEEGNVGEAPELTPTPEALAAVPTPAAEAVEAPATAAQPESLLSRIGPTTPPNVAAALRLIEEGRQQLNDGHAETALDRFERAVAIDPANAYGYYFLAQLHYLKKNYDQAIAFASRAAVLSARTDRIWLARVYSLEGAVFEDVGRYPDARKAYQKAVEADSQNLAARVGVARLSLGE